ncbi:hypothetical protein [Roseimaritima sediminicola]|uniref:hypothetical protein n=1 Tax=Roseimaritima sediminicola TaxID=2662066 RepID=UPI00129855FD|nr:hypothetical protein [Roseimaritima sediminicola]
MFRIRLSAISLNVLLAPLCLLPLMAGCGGDADPGPVASSTATDSGDVGPPGDSDPGGGAPGESGGAPGESGGAPGESGGGGSDDAAYMEGYMDDPRGGGGEEEYGMGPEEYGMGPEEYGMGPEEYGMGPGGEPYDMYGGESMDGAAGMYGQTPQRQSSGMLAAVTGSLQGVGPQLASVFQTVRDKQGREEIKTFRELANEAFVGGDEALALQYLYGHMASEYELAGPALNDVAYSRALAKPVWFVRWGASLHVRADATETPHPIVEGMSSPLPERSAAGGRFGRRGRGRGMESPEMASPEMESPEGGYGMEGMGGMEGGMLPAGRGGTPGGDASNRVDQTLAESLGLVSDVVGRQFDTRFANGAFGKAFQNVEVTPPPARANRGGSVRIDERTGEAIRDPSAMMDAGPEGYGPEGYGAEGYGAEGYGAEGYGAEGYGAEGYGAEGYGAEGYGAEGYGASQDPAGGYPDPAAQMRAGMEGYGVGAPAGSGADYGAEAADYMAPGGPGGPGEMARGANRPGAARAAAPAPPRFSPALPRWRPGMVFVGEMPLSEALSAAKENGLQFLFHFDVIVQGGKKTRTIVRVINVADGKTVVASKRLDNVECYKLVQAKQTSEPKYVEEAVLPMFDVIDEKLQVAELPAVSAAQAKARIAKLLETAPAFDLASMAEVRLFQSRDLLTEPEVATAMHLFGGDDALVLIYGSPAERRTIIRQQIEP